MHRFFAEEKEGSTLVISDPVDVSHLKNVLRLKEGDTIEAVHEKVLYHAVIRETGSSVLAMITEFLDSPEEEFNLTIIQGLPKGQKVDEILQHGTEVGVSSFIITEMKRSVSKGAEKKRERYERILKDAAKQSKALQVPHLSFLSLQEIDYDAYDQIFLLDEEESENRVFPELMSRVALIVGPEGGIHEEERAFLQALGAVSISLGDRILRTEVAGVSTAFLLSYLKGTAR